MTLTRGLTGAFAATLITALLCPSPAANATEVAQADCKSSSHPALAARLTGDIEAARRDRVSLVALEVDDPGLGLACWLDSSRHFDSASVVKVTIAAALLRRAQDQHKGLTKTEAGLAWAMITRSDNDAAAALWAALGRRYLQHFLDLAGMTHTTLGPGAAWGLTQITAADEMLLLRLLQDENPVLDTSSRDYVLDLMAEVVPGQRWGVTEGAQAGLTAHVKNGWLPLVPGGWRIHSIGCFTGRDGGYRIVV